MRADRDHEQAGCTEAETASGLKRRLVNALGAAGIEEPQREARRILDLALGRASGGFLTDDTVVDSAAAARALAILARRLKREPLSRIAGMREFYGRTFVISPDTLDPRPESETIIDAVKEIAAAEGLLDAPLSILDIGTGSGSLLLTLLAELPAAYGVGTDISAGALRVARENAERFALASRARFEERRSLRGMNDTFDFVVANPPYIPSGEIDALMPEVRDFDPRAALDGGADGLDIYRELAPEISRATPRGWVFFEIGAGQADEVIAILSGFAPRPSEVRTWTDLGGHIRCVALRTQS